MQTENAPSAATSPQGRRVLVAIVDGPAGEVVQRWREQFDPEQAKRIPPHTTLCYWVPAAPDELLDRQVRYAFPKSIPVELRGLGEFMGEQRTFFVPVKQTAALDAARDRLYDGTHLSLGKIGHWTWHVTCVRDATGMDIPAIHAAAMVEFGRGEPWLISHIECLELRGERYVPVAEWRL